MKHRKLTAARTAGRYRREAKQRAAKMYLLAAAFVIPLFMGLLVYTEGKSLELQYEIDQTMASILSHYEHSRIALSDIEYLQSYSGADTYLARKRDAAVQEFAAADLKSETPLSESAVSQQDAGVSE